jgi:hypothetical protein
MTTAWLVNLVGLFLTTTGALLVFLYLWKSPRFAKEWLTPEGQQAYAKHRRLLVTGVGLLVVWILLQYLAVILL